jgi:serine/threonine-protein kinase
MAEVYLAHDDVLDRDVALKVMSGRYADDDEFVERFRREAQSAAALSHPNIVSIYDRGESEDGTYYIAMEYLSGGTLKDRILKRGALPPRTAAAVALQIAEALRVAHRAGVVHRDIKPHNVLITANGDVKVGDFGIARAASSSTMTRTGSILGTAHYISPEQAMGEPVGPQSDLYSLGVVLYEMLTGELPYDAETPIGIAMKHVNGHLAEPKAVNPSVPDGINAVTMRLLAKGVDDRYGSAGELIRDLERVLDGLAPTSANGARTATTRIAPAGMAVGAAAAPTRRAPAPPPRSQGRGERHRRRSPWLPLLALLLLLALVAGAVYALTSSRDDPQTQQRVPQVAVPNLVGASSLAEAQEMAGDDFEVVVGDRVEAEAPLSSVVAQDPAEGARVDRGSEVEVDVVNTRVATLPDVTGESEGEARRTLEDAGFDVEVETRESEETDRGRVVGQEPSGGGGEQVEVEPGPTTVTLTVGEGPAIARVPELTGLSPAEAEAALGEVGLALGEQGQESSDTVQEGLVVTQSPAPGVEVREESAVAVNISTGPELYPVPDVTGGGVQEAQAELAEAGFSLGSQTGESSDEVPEGGIISQDPAAGTGAEAGTAVGVTVSTGPEVIVVPNVVGQDWVTAAQTLQAEGLSVYQRVNKVPSNEPENTVLSTNPGAGEEVEVGSAPVRLTVSSGPSESGGGEEQDGGGEEQDSGDDPDSAGDAGDAIEDAVDDAVEDAIEDATGGGGSSGGGGNSGRGGNGGAE